MSFEIPPSHKGFPPLLAVFALVIMIGSMGAWYYLSYVYTSDGSSTEKSDKKNSPVSEVDDIDNPVLYFYDHFSQKNYRVKTFTNSKAATDSSRMNSVNYYEKGKLFRIDIIGKYGNSTVIFKDGKIYSLDHTEKTYTKNEIDHPLIRSSVAFFKMLSTIDFLIGSEYPGAAAWERITKDTSTHPNVITYQSKKREFKPLGETVYWDTHIDLDSETGLITRFSDTKGYEVFLEYEEIQDVDGLKKFSSDYTQRNPGLSPMHDEVTEMLQNDPVSR